VVSGVCFRDLFAAKSFHAVLRMTEQRGRVPARTANQGRTQATQSMRCRRKFISQFSRNVQRVTRTRNVPSPKRPLQQRHNSIRLVALLLLGGLYGILSLLWVRLTS
jgi:hypothetical protein